MKNKIATNLLTKQLGTVLGGVSVAVLLTISMFLSAGVVQAVQCGDAGTYGKCGASVGCQDKWVCQDVCVPISGICGYDNSTLPSSREIIGPIPVPPGTEAYNKAAGTADNPEDFALIFFLSNLIKIATIIAGVWVVFNVVRAGFLYLTQSGKSSAPEKVRNLLTMSVLGLLLIIVAYTLAGIVGLLLFGDASYIINPTLPRPTQ